MISDPWFPPCVVDGQKEKNFPRQGKRVSPCPGWYHIYGIQVGQRSELIERLKKAGIQTGIHYPLPLPHQEAYRYLSHKTGDFLVAEKLAESILSLPIYPEMTTDAQGEVIEGVRGFYR